MIYVERLRRNWAEREIDGRWYLAKPEAGPLRRRIKDAWKVLTGRAMAVRFETDICECDACMHPDYDGICIRCYPDPPSSG